MFGRFSLLFLAISFGASSSQAHVVRGQGHRPRVQISGVLVLAEVVIPHWDSRQSSSTGYVIKLCDPNDLTKCSSKNILERPLTAMEMKKIVDVIQTQKPHLAQQCRQDLGAAVGASNAAGVMAGSVAEMVLPLILRVFSIVIVSPLVYIGPIGIAWAGVASGLIAGTASALINFGYFTYKRVKAEREMVEVADLLGQGENKNVPTVYIVINIINTILKFEKLPCNPRNDVVEEL